MVQQRSAAIDALRGFAAIAVVFYHAHEINWNGVSTVWHKTGLSPDLNASLSYLAAPVYFGFAAVALFFVISGYCIHRPNVGRLSQDPAYELDLKTYFTRRLWRIYPVLVAALLLTGALDAYTRGHFPHDYKLGDTSWRSFLVNLLTIQNLAGPTFGSNGPLWTLGMELHFYFLYPLLFWGMKHFGTLRTVACVLVLSVISIVLLRSARSELVIFLPYWFTWSIGVLIAECESGRIAFAARRWRVLIVAAALAAGGLALKNERLLAEPFFAIAFGALVLWSVRHRDRCLWSRVPLRLLAGVGLFSYSLYATHAPFLLFLRSFLQGSTKSDYVYVPILFTCFCVALALVVFGLVERWSLKVPGRISVASRAPESADPTLQIPTFHT